jgi:hypothetical protein
MNGPLYPLKRSLLAKESRVDNAVAIDFVARKEAKCAKLYCVSAVTG